MVLARASITLTHVSDIVSVTWYYRLQASTASAPAKPTTEIPAGWTTTEPPYTEGSTNNLYITQKTVFSDDSFAYADVSLSSAYEAAKAAYNKSVQAKETADQAQESVDNLEIGGRNLLLDSSVIHSTKTYRLNIYSLSDRGQELQEGDIVTFSMKARLATDRHRWAIYNSGGNCLISGWMTISPDGETDAIYTWTGEWKTDYNGTPVANTQLYIYAGTTSGPEYNIIYWAKLERGAKATDWTAAPEDFESAIASTQADVDALKPELIVGTHGSTATAAWTGTSTVLSEIRTGTRIQFKLSSAGASNVTLNLTLKSGTATGAKPVYYLNTTRLGTQYGINAVVDLIYDGSAWRVLNPYTNSNTVGTYAGAVKAGANGVKNYSLIMKDTETTWVSLTTTAGTGTEKERYTGGLYPDKVLYMGSSVEYASGATTGTCYEALGFNLNYSTNSGSTLTAGRPVYLVGEIHSDGLFYLDATWWTQTVPTTEDGKTYIYLGLASSTTNVYLTPENALHQFFEGKFRRLSEIEEIKAARVANNYLSSDNTGIMVANMTDGNQYTPSDQNLTGSNVFITAGYGSGSSAETAGVKIRSALTVLASFGASLVRLGQAAAKRIDITSAGVYLYSAATTLLGSFTASGVSLYASGVLRSALTAAGLKVYDTDGSTELASFGTTATIGKASAAHVNIASDKMELYNSGSSKAVEIGQLQYIAWNGTQTTETGEKINGTLYVRKVAVNASSGSSWVEVNQANISGSGGRLVMTGDGRFGLHDGSKWVIDTSGGEVRIDQKPLSSFYRPSAAETLNADKVTATAVSTTYRYVSFPLLADFNVVVILLTVNNARQALVFPRPMGSDQIISDTPASGTYFRGGVVVDWTNNRIGVRCLNGSDASLVYFQHVYGIF